VADESTVRKHYLKQCYDLTIENIRDIIYDNSEWISIDETQYCERRFTANIVVGFLSKNKQSTSHLLTVEQFEAINIIFLSIA
jgi:hypothetical protein